MIKTQELIIGAHKILFSEQYSDSQGPVVVFLHGWASSIQPFESIIKTVPNYFAFNYPGFSSDTELVSPMDLDAYTDITKELLNKKLSDKQIIFVVHSFGGRVLVNLLNKYPMTTIRQTIWIGVPFIRAYTLKHKVIEAGAFMTKQIIQIFPEKIQSVVKKKIYRIIGSDYGALETEVMKQTFRNIIGQDISTMTGVIPQYNPHFIWGEHDSAAPLAQAKTVSEIYTIPIAVIPGADHFPFLGKTQAKFIEVFNQIIIK